jgi:hypothetical protein
MRRERTRPVLAVASSFSAAYRSKTAKTAAERAARRVVAPIKPLRSTGGWHG